MLQRCGDDVPYTSDNSSSNDTVHPNRCRLHLYVLPASLARRIGERTNAELRNPASHLERDVALAPLALPSPSMCSTATLEDTMKLKRFSIIQFALAVAIVTLSIGSEVAVGDD